MYVCFRCELRGFRGCVESYQAVAAVVAAIAPGAVPGPHFLRICLPNPLSHHLHQLEGTRHHLCELYRETTACTSAVRDWCCIEVMGESLSV